MPTPLALGRVRLTAVLFASIGECEWTLPAGSVVNVLRERANGDLQLMGYWAGGELKTWWCSARVFARATAAETTKRRGGR